jgi:hypothetical protein
MKKLIKAIAEWLFAKTDRGESLKADNLKLVTMLVAIREQYRKFGLLSPSMQFDMNSTIDTFKGGLSKETSDFIKKRCDVSIEEIDVVSRVDYDSLRSSHQQLLLLVARYQIQIDAASNISGYKISG